MLYQVPCEEYDEKQYNDSIVDYFYFEKEHKFDMMGIDHEMIETVYGEQKPIRAFIKEVIERDENDDLWEPTDLRTVSKYYRNRSKYIIGPKDDPSVYVYPVFFCKRPDSDMVYSVTVVLKKYI